MRITSAELPHGTTYRIHRASEAFLAEVEKLVPFLLRVRDRVLIGGTADDPSVVITIEPLPREAERAFLDVARPYLA